MVASNSSSRAQQSRDTQARIIEAARDLFAELGYERTTIRKVARVAGVDPALAIHYFRSKPELFVQATTHVETEISGSSPEGIVNNVMRTLHDRLTEEPTASLAVLRSMLTHDAAAGTYQRASDQSLGQIASAISAPDPRLRASVVVALISGILVQRWLLGKNPLSDATPDDVTTLLRPCIEHLVGAVSSWPDANDND